jgi:anti-sigma regulatory factor (Ser/Thr protein kinase)
MTPRRLELHGAFTIDEVSDVRRFVERLNATIGDDDVSTRVAMAAHELFENAIKFAVDGMASIEIDVTPMPGRISITTRNRANLQDLADLRETAGKLHASQDSMAFYVDLMRTSRKQRGGLGIGRVAAEAEMRVAFGFEDDFVVVHAELVPEAHAA